MKPVIRKPRLEEFASFSKMIWKSFYFAEKNNVSVHGMEHFRDLIEPPVLQYEYLCGTHSYLGAYCCEVPVGLIAYSEHRVVLLFVSCEHQRLGIGGELLFRALQNMSGEEIRVNSGLSAVSFYSSLGMEPEQEVVNENELLFLPMRAKKEQILANLKKRSHP